MKILKVLFLALTLTFVSNIVTNAQEKAAAT
jgi:hypothetical protein